MSSVEEVIQSALQGDQRSIKELAAHLENARAAPALAEQAAADKFQFLEASKDFFREYADVASRPDFLQMMRDYDGQLSREKPDLPYRQRLKIVGDTMRRWQDENEGGDEHARPQVIANIRKARRPDLPDTTEGLSSYTVTTDRVEAEHDSDVSETIREMAEARRRQREEIGED